MLLAEQAVDRDVLTLLQRRQPLFTLLNDVVHVFLVDGDEAGEHQCLPAGAKQRVRVSHAQVHRRGVKAGGRHLTRQRALPDHLVEPRLVRSQVRAYLIRRPRDGGRPDTFVRLLSILGFAAVVHCALGQVICT